MELKILGSGGDLPTPRPFCQCKICENARKRTPHYKRNGSSLYIKEAKTIIDTPEEINDSINRENLKREDVDNIFITHWHPDHTFGLRSLLEANYDYRNNKPMKVINLFLAKNVFAKLTEIYDVIKHLRDYKKLVKIHFLEDGESVELGSIKITSIGYNTKEPQNYGFLLEEGEKKVLYTPCDTIDFENFTPKCYNLDLLINECGMMSDYPWEISFSQLIKRVRGLNPKKLILTHIEEDELRECGWDCMDKMKKYYSDIDLEFGHDGMVINL